MLLGKKCHFSRRKQNGEKQQKEEEEFMKSTLTDVNKIKSLWIRYFFVLAWGIAALGSCAFGSQIVAWTPFFRDVLQSDFAC